jgi:hypothetical protein
LYLVYTIVLSISRDKYRHILMDPLVIHIH